MKPPTACPKTSAVGQSDLQRYRTLRFYLPRVIGVGAGILMSGLDARPSIAVEPTAANGWLEKRIPDAIRTRASRYGEHYAVESTATATTREEGRVWESVIRQRKARSGKFGLQSTTQDGQKNEDRVFLQTRAVNSKYYFEVTRNKRNDAWLLSRVLDLPVSPPDDAETTVSLRAAVEDSALRGMGVPLLVGGYTLPEELSSLPGFRLVSVVEEKPGEVVAIQFEYTLKLGASESAASVCTAKYSTTALEPLLGYTERAVSRNTERLRGNTKHFSDTSDGGYSVTSTGYFTVIENGKTTYDRKSEAKSIVRFGPTPESEFTCTAFGLPEPPGIDWSPSTPLYVWLAVGGVACLAAFGGFRYLAGRNKS